MSHLVDHMSKIGIGKSVRQWEDASLQAQVEAPLKLLPQSSCTLLPDSCLGGISIQARAGNADNLPIKKRQVSYTMRLLDTSGHRE